MIAFRIVISKFPSLVSLEERYVLFFSVTSMNLLNSFIHKITCGTTTLVEGEESEMRIARPPAEA